MDIKDLMKLIDAGFTKDEIVRLLGDKPVEETKTTQTETKEEPKEPKEPEKQEEEKKPESQPVNDPRLDDIIKGLQKVTETMQKTAVLDSRQPVQESVDDILARIIDPTYRKE